MRAEYGIQTFIAPYVQSFLLALDLQSWIWSRNMTGDEQKNIVLALDLQPICSEYGFESWLMSIE